VRAPGMWTVAKGGFCAGVGARSELGVGVGVGVDPYTSYGSLQPTYPWVADAGKQLESEGGHAARPPTRNATFHQVSPRTA
jgi:hypothetical protein